MAAGPRPLGVKKKGAGVAAGRHGAETTQPRLKVNGKGGGGGPFRKTLRLGARASHPTPLILRTTAQ